MMYHWTKYTVKRHDTLERILRRIGFNLRTVQEVLHSGPPAKQLHHLKPKAHLYIHFDQHHQLEALRYDVDSRHNLMISREKGHFEAAMHEISLEPHIHYATGIINNSLYAAAQAAKLPMPLIDELAHVLGWDIDFAHDIKAGDHFTVLYSDLYHKDKMVKFGHILAAEFVNNRHVYRFIRYTDPNGHTGYYTPAGHSVKRKFIRTPVKFTRISSRFNLKRRHPILDILRPHRGVDYAAPTGTPVKTTADGVVVFRGKRRGYGNVVEIDHGHDYHTLYAHLSRFHKKLKKGSHVRQEQVIAYVGQTGMATGPHLHYEFRIRGRHHDPLKVRLPAAEPIAKGFRNMFIDNASGLLAQLDLYRTAMRASEGAPLTATTKHMSAVEIED